MIVALALFVESATLVAVTVTICCCVMLAGAVYKPPALSAPIPEGLTDQVTLWLLPPETVAENC